MTLNTIAPCLVVLVTLMVSCVDRFQEKEIYGTYSPIKYSNTSDTIELLPNGVYRRRVYNRDNELVLKQSANWFLKDNVSIYFESHFWNFDRDLVQYPELLQDTLDRIGGAFVSEDGKIKFCVGYYRGENCYEKIK